MNAKLERVEVYACPNGIYERYRTRAVARMLVDLVKNKTGGDHLSLTAALVLVAKRDEVEALLREAGDMADDNDAG